MLLGPTTAAEYEVSDRGTLYVSSGLLVQASKVWSQLYMTWFGASTMLRVRIPRDFSKPLSARACIIPKWLVAAGQAEIVSLNLLHSSCSLCRLIPNTPMALAFPHFSVFNGYQGTVSDWLRSSLSRARLAARNVNELGLLLLDLHVC